MDGYFPLEWLPTQWHPFQIDALGLVTMIGADEVNATVGRLVRSRYTEYLPILGAFIIAGDQFTRSLPGYALYNIDDGITTTDLAGWFSRYLRAQQIRQSVSALSFKIYERHVLSTWRDKLLAALLSFLVNAVLFVLAIVQRDWWGLVNVISMLVSIAVRSILVAQNRKALDEAAEKAYQVDSKPVRVVCLLPDGKMLTIYTPVAVLRECFIKKPVPPNAALYNVTRMIGWAFFAAHVISIGMSSLVVQIVSVVVLCGSTIMVARNVGCQECQIGSRLSIKRVGSEDLKLRAFPEFDGANGDRRQNAYVFLEPNAEEMESMLQWNLVPHRTNRDWWRVHDAKARVWPQRKVALKAPARHEASWQSQATSIALSQDPEKPSPSQDKRTF